MHSHKRAARASSKAKFKAITGHKSGGQVHPDEKQDRALFHKMMAEHEHKSHGSKGHHRVDKRARGGGVKHKKHGDVNVNVVIPHRHPMPMPAPMAGLPHPPVGAPMGAPPPGGLPPGFPPVAGGGPPGMPPMKRGGRAYKRGGYIEGESTAGNIAKWSNRAKKNSVEHAARGGRMTAGAMSGVGRLQKAHKAH